MTGLGHTLQNWVKQGFTVIVSTDQPNRAKSVLAQVGIHPADDALGALGAEGDQVSRSSGDRHHDSRSPDHLNTRSPKAPPAPKAPKASVILTRGNLAGGFVFPDHKLAVVTDAELFGVARLRLPQKRFMEGAPIATVLDLKPGDYVVHINFGIGVFRGLAKREIEGVQKEFLAIDYAPPDKLFVPADQLDRIQKYLNPADTQPKLNRLTGGEWQRTISKAKEDARAFAADLVKLYAERKRVQRRPFGQDTPFQAEVEATFPWVETPSQMHAIREVKNDMQLDWPMDRLVCGDVGFGKTEVAIRAAFKCVESGRQCAVLCPTTILSEQHYRNFAERLAEFGVRIELLNRYTHAGHRRQIIEGLKDGSVDIVIGTHALLGKEIEFKNLGLLVVDEEQHFGVKHKETLKKLRTEVDVLTLSATPIPRTLSMALMDIRQMSLITDPPPGRLPIRTFVRPYSQEVVREAVLREMARGGQVFYVYNRVESIMHIAERLRKLVPHAKIGVGHGQMGEKELEPVMIAFIKGELDVLLSTTIVESGLDIPNANTLIVENADRLGLAQLYQLRGRVGRSDRQAYAYLLYQTGKELSEGGMQRLTALQEFSSLGSGYSLAFRDLQIRGAGELLGAKQSGSMAAVGYELYQQLINDAVAQMKAIADTPSPASGERGQGGEGLPGGIEPLPAADIPVVALLPDTYIRDHAQRLYFYQKMMGARSPEQLGEVAQEIEDRYGHPPAPARNAFEIMRLRMRMRDLGMDKLDAKGGRIAVNFKDKQSISPRVFSIIGKKNRECYVTREQFIWPFTGDPLIAVTRMLDGFEGAVRQMEEERAALA
jgi:transcription-repair coupling factor (superfamily II helicase)